MKEMRIVIIGHFGRQNTGDDAMLFSLIKELMNMFSGSKIRVLSTSRDARFNYNWIGLSSLVFHKSSFSVLMKDLLWANILLFGGGSQIHIHKNTKRYSKNLIAFYLIIMLAKFIGKKIVFMGIGVGPLSTYISKMIARKIFEKADFINVRDEYSMRCIRNINIIKKENKQNIIKGIDLALLLSLEVDLIKKEYDDEVRVIGCSLLPYFRLYEKSPEFDYKMISVIGKTIREWLSKDIKREFNIFVFHGSSREGDAFITDNLIRIIDRPQQVKRIDYCPDPRETLLKLHKCDVFIGMRYHSLVFSYIAKLPMLVIAYHPKCEAFANEIGLPKEAILSMRDVLYEEKFQNKFEKLAVSHTKFNRYLDLNKAVECYNMSYYQLKLSLLQWFY